MSPILPISCRDRGVLSSQSFLLAQEVCRMMGAPFVNINELLSSSRVGLVVYICTMQGEGDVRQASVIMHVRSQLAAAFAACVRASA